MTLATGSRSKSFRCRILRIRRSLVLFNHFFQFQDFTAGQFFFAEKGGQKLRQGASEGTVDKIVAFLCLCLLFGYQNRYNGLFILKIAFVAELFEGGHNICDKGKAIVHR